MGIDKLTAYLKDWLYRFIVNRDLIPKKIDNIADENSLLITNLKNGNKRAFLVIPFLEDVDAVFKELKDYPNCAVVVYNSKKNMDSVVKHWEKLIKFNKHFSIYFVNPFSRMDKKWIVYPYTHNMISDKKGWKEGLLSLYNNVEEVNIKELEKIIGD